MKTASLLQRSAVVFAAFTMACGDSTGPGNLSEAQVGEMVEAMQMVSMMAMPSDDQASFAADPLRAFGERANATVSYSETVDCPDGGSASVNGTVTGNDAGTSLTAQLTQNFSACRATAESGRVWTFDGNPSIVTTLNATSNEAAGTFTLSWNQVGGITYASDLGSGNCQVNLTFTMSGTASSLTASLSGSACGRNIQRSITVTE